MAFEFPFSLAPKTTAKAAEVMGNFNAVKTLLTSGIPTENLADQSVTTAKVANGAIGKAQLASGYGVKHSFGVFLNNMPAGTQLGGVGAFPHGLGVTPNTVEFTFLTAPNFAIVFEMRLIALDATNFTCQLVLSTNAAGPFSTYAYWHAMAA